MIWMDDCLVEKNTSNADHLLIMSHENPTVLRKLVRLHAPSMKLEEMYVSIIAIITVYLQDRNRKVLFIVEK